MAEGFEGGKDGGDLIGALFVFAAEAGGDGFGVLADGSEQLAHRHDLLGHGFGPSEGSGYCLGWFLVVGKGDF